MQCSPNRSRSVIQLPSRSSFGAWKMLALRMWRPGGARVGSAMVGNSPQKSECHAHERRGCVLHRLTRSSLSPLLSQSAS